MNIWLITTGSSDVQLKTDEYWDDWYRLIKPDCYGLPFKPTQTIPNLEDPYRIAPRVLGMTYQACPEEVWQNLEFPLLDDFITHLPSETLNQIILLLTDQNKVFDEDDQEDLKCPFWQDTQELQPIFERYFQIYFPKTDLVPLKIAPRLGEPGLDNWDFVLKIVNRELKKKITGDPCDVYVSHQAGTPAISSAVQFCSLAQFGHRVKFLVSNEYNRTVPEKPLEGSSYLRGIRIQEAKALLDSHNYSGVKDLLDFYLKDEKNQETKILLEAAIQWNFARFDKFAEKLEELSDQDLAQVVKERSQQWWWTAYEAAYLAIIRLDKQKDKDTAKNTVDALFHSFRAIEGIFAEWGVQQFQKHIQMKNDRPYLQTTILDDEQYFNRAKYKEKDGKQIPDNDIAKLKDKLEDLKRQQKDTVFYGFTVYSLFREVRRDWKHKCKSISRFWDANKGISEKRNKIFHQLKGLTENELFEIWEVNSFDAWKERMREFANFVSDQTFESLDQECSDGRVASLMVKVHQELVDAIENL